MARKAMKQITYDTIIRGTNDTIPVSFTRNNSEGETVAYDLTGKLLILTVKKAVYDTSLNDDTAQESEIDDYAFRVTIDCDDPTEGRTGPSTQQEVWKNNYQGMYGQDPAEGKATFRLTKKMTMVDPGTYNFDIRIMEKNKTTIGEVVECRDWCPIFGSLEIQGTPTNRSAAYDWEESE